MKNAYLKEVKTDCSKVGCRRKGRFTVRKWSRDFGPYCADHAEEVRKDQDEFDEMCDAFTHGDMKLYRILKRRREGAKNP